jgi:hypothetical protein
MHIRVESKFLSQSRNDVANAKWFLRPGSAIFSPAAVSHVRALTGWPGEYCRLRPALRVRTGLQ